MSSKVTKYKDIFMIVTKANSTWEETMKEGRYTVVPLSEQDYAAIIMDLEEEHLVIEPEKFKAYDVPVRFETFKLKNASLENKTYLILIKEELLNEHN